MSNKIGRNDQCLCGSGKKYKKCCLQIDEDMNRTANLSTYKQEYSFSDFFSSYNSIDLISILAILSIYPNNHGKNVRLEYLLMEAFKSFHNGSNDRPISCNELKAVLSKHLGFCELEDPPSNLFTENITFTTGNQVVYGGNFEQGAFTLNTLTSAIHFNLDKFTPAFIAKIDSAVKLLLHFSNTIALNLGHERNMLGVFDGREIQFPPNLDTLKSHLFFSIQNIKEYCASMSIDPSIVDSFTLNIEDVYNFRNELGSETNPLLFKPLMKIANGLLIASPTTILVALVHFIWLEAKSFNCLEELLKQYHKSNWDELMTHLRKLEIKPLAHKFISDPALPIKNALFRIDSDKVCILNFIYDEGKDYDLISIFHSDTTFDRSELFLLQDKNFQAIKQSFSNSKILELNIYSSIGRHYILKSIKRDDSFTQQLSVYHFLCWLNHDSLKGMDLWYFCEAVENLTGSAKLIAPTFLNLYSYYSKHHHSFYFGDDARPDGIHFVHGGDLSIIHEAILREDRKLVYHRVEQFKQPVFLPVVKLNEYTPRYSCLSFIGNTWDFHTPGYPFDLWISTLDYSNEMSPDFRGLIWELGEAFSYWLWEVRNFMYEHLKVLPLYCYSIKYAIAEVGIFMSENAYTTTSSSMDHIQASINKNEIVLTFYPSLKSILQRSDNEGERILLKKTIEAFGELLILYNFPNTLSEDIVDAIIEEKAPLGLKKMLLFIHSQHDIGLDPRNLIEPRYLKEACVQKVMDLLIPLLGKNCPPLGKINDKVNRELLAKNVAKCLLEYLRKYLQDYNSKDLLLHIMAIHEAVLHENALTKLRTPTRRACYKDYENITEELLKKANISDESTITLRCLIEHLAAESSEGNKIITDQTIDDVMAIMSLIVYWGSLGDEIKYELFNVELWILESGRIGTNSENTSNQFVKEYKKNRIKEFISDSSEYFSTYFGEAKINKIPTPEKFEQAFTEEVGISFRKLGGIMSLLTQLSFEQEGKVSSLTFEQLFSYVHISFTDENYTREEIRSAISFLSLSNRGKVEIIPSGFLNRDISPWRYNRRLSYLQRPLILSDSTGDKDEPIIHWTPRNVDLGWKYLNSLFLSGRYRAKEKSKLEKAISGIIKDRGSIVKSELKSWLQSQTNLILDEDVEISPNGKLKNHINIGDIDVLIIDKNNKIVLSVECKRTEDARNPKEMIEQVDQYFGTKSKKGYLEKHLNRHRWIIENISQVAKVYACNLKDYKVYSFLLSYEILAIQFMKNRNLPLPIISIFELNEFDYDTMVSKMNKCYGY